jgi:hypothetical protein
VAVLRAMLAEGLLTQVAGGCAVTATGTRRLAELGVDIPTISSPAATFAPCHPDWSENAHHLAGPLAEALTRRFLHLGWISHRRSGRAVRLTPAGLSGLRDHFHTDLTT